MINIVAIYFSSCGNVRDDESNAGWRSNGSTILVSKATHTSSFWLLHNIEVVLAARNLVYL